MHKLRATLVLTLLMGLGSASFFLTSCGEKSARTSIIFTRTTGKIGNSDISEVDSKKINLRSEIVAIEPGNSDVSPKVLTSSFFSARSPEISYDGQFMIFTGKKTESDPWQIWEADLGNLKTRQLTKMKEDCTDPAYLPLGRFLFTCHSATDSLKSTQSIFTSNIDGTDTKRITYNPKLYSASHVLNDGRILTIGEQEYPESGDQKYIVMRPDGTKAELFYKGDKGNELSGRGVETSNGRIIFIESEQKNPFSGSLISVSYNRPSHSRTNLSSGTEGDFRSVFPQHSGTLLVSFRNAPGGRYGLYEFDPEKKSLGKPIYLSNDFDVLEVAEAVKHNRPKKLPSEVNTVIKTGLIMCQDVNAEFDTMKISGTIYKSISKVEIMGTDSSLGIFKPSDDGSFYLKVIANKPFQIRTLDEKGKVIRKCDWIWLCPNERRGCVGCHEDQDIVPDNHIPLAVKKAPVGIPIHINKIKDKMIDTE